MNKNKLFALAISLTVAAANVTPGIQAFAGTTPVNITSNASVIPQPRFSYTIMANLSLDVNSSGAHYNVDIEGISSVTKISGTVTLYKENSSGSYVKVKSKAISGNSNTLDVYGSFPVSGSGNYKATFTGKVYAPGGHDQINLSITDSY